MRRQLPTMTKFELTLKIPVSINMDDLDGVTIDEISKSLNYTLDTWDDGRYPLDVELLSHAASRLVKAAITSAIQDLHEKKHPGCFEYENGSTAKWVVTSRRIVKRIMHFFTNTWSGSIQ